MAEDEGAAPEKSAAPPSSVFAVKTTQGEERRVADKLRDRAAKERVDVRAVWVPRGAEGLVLVEGADLARITNLVASVGHARGIVAPRSALARDDPALSPARVKALLDGAEPDEDIEAWLFAQEGSESSAEPESGSSKEQDDEEPEAGGEEEAPSEDEGAPENPRPSKPKKNAAPPPKKKARNAPSGALPALTPESARLVNILMVAPVAFLAIGLLTMPGLFWDRFLYPYFWQSIDADASNAGGAAEAYNVVNTIAYALILVPALLLIYRVLERLKIRVDTRFVVMLTPFLVLGGAARALEDAQYFSKPLSYAFISPLIYIAEGLFVLALVVAAWWVARARRRGGVARGVAAWTLAFLPGAAVLTWFHMSPSGGLASPIPAPIVWAAIASAYLAGLVLVQRTKRPSVHGLVAVAGLLLLALCAYLIARWILLRGWDPAPVSPATTHVGDVPAVIALATLATLLTAAGLFLVSTRFPKFANTLNPLTILLFFAQYLDASATYWGIDYWGYQEKHVAAGFLITMAGTAVVMFPMKLVYVLVVAYLTDVLFRPDLYDAEGEITSFGGLLKLVVIALGMGPGTRDMLRMAMGV